MKHQLTKSSLLKDIEFSLEEADINEPLDILIDSVNKNNEITIYGKFAFDAQLANRLKIRAKLLSYIKNKSLPKICLLYTSPSPRDRSVSRMPSSA